MTLRKHTIFFSLLATHYVTVMLLNTPVEAVEYRLPQSTIPINYAIIIELDVDAFSTDKFKGQVNITLDILDETDNIQIHSKDLQIMAVNLTRLNETLILINRSYTSDPVTDILKIGAENKLSAGRYYLYIIYNGMFSLDDMHGFYKSSYENEEGETEYLAATQFESTHARRAFPCFDEPNFKATFNVSFIYPKEYNVIANTLPRTNKTEISGVREIVTFKSTPIMSTYLNAFIISKFSCNLENNDIQYRVCSRRQTADDREYALEISPKLIKYMEMFTDIPYNSVGIGKMDQVAIPDFSASAMENWGLVTYREAAILCNQNQSSNAHKQRVASIIAHEFAHMWFGNLVTLKWWSDVFLNEGFARYFQYLAVAHVESEWQLDKQFVVEQVQSALIVDSLETSQALSSNVNTPQEISNKFDSVSYNKGASIIRMISHMLGSEQFQLGIQRYLQKHKLDNTVPEDLWNSLTNLSQLPYNINNIIENWILQPGYPALYVRENGTNIVITQERFLLSGKNDTKWYVPITYTTSNDDKKFTNTTTRDWLTPYNSELILKDIITNKSSWIILNNQQIGFYRINYDKNLWNKIYITLKNNPGNVDIINRAHIVDDLFNFARASKIAYSRVFEITSFLSEDSDYYPWFSAFNGFSYILQKINNQDIRIRFSKYIEQLMNKLYNSVPIDKENPDNQIYTLKQVMAVNWACKLNKAECINSLKQTFSDYKHSNDTINPSKNLRSAIYCTSLRHSDNIEEDWVFLWKKLKKTKIATEKVTILSALGCTSNEPILNRYLHYAINTSSGIRMQDSTLVFSSVYDDNPSGIKITLQFLFDNYEQVYNYYYNNEKTISSLIKALADRLTNQSQVDQLVRLIQSGKLNTALKKSAQTALESATDNLKWIKAMENELTIFFSDDDDDSGSNLVISSQFATVLPAIVFLIHHKLL